jgi:hypothetical protein
MNLTKKLFGAQRLILDEMGYTDSFVIPAGHCVTRVIAETVDEMQTGGSLSLGSANSGIETASFSVASLTTNVYEQQQFTVQVAEGAIGGTVTIAGKEIVLQAEDVASTATAVSALVFGFGGADPNWELASADNTMTLLAKTYGDKTLQTITKDAGLTGVTFSAVTEFIKGSAAPVAGDITVAGEKVTLIEADVATVTKVAEKIAAHSFTDWTVERNGAGLVFTALGEGAIDNVTVALDTATGIAFSAVTTAGSVNHAEIAAATALRNTAGGLKEIPVVLDGCYAPVAASKTAYVNLTFGEMVNNFKLYVSMEKYI